MTLGEPQAMSPLERALRDVPLIPCKRCYACLYGTGRCADLRPDYPSLAKAAAAIPKEVESPTVGRTGTTAPASTPQGEAGQ